MRYKLTQCLKGGTKGIKRKFLWFPKALPVLLTEDYELRWLEFAYIEYEWVSETTPDLLGGRPSNVNYWKAIGWVQEK